MASSVDYIDLTGDDDESPPLQPRSRPSSSTPATFRRHSPSVRSRADSVRRTPAARTETRRRTAVHISDIIDHDVIDVDLLPDPPPERPLYPGFENQAQQHPPRQRRMMSDEPEVEITHIRFSRPPSQRPPSQQPLGGFRPNNGGSGPSRPRPPIFMENVQFPERNRNHDRFYELDLISRTGLNISRAGGNFMNMLRQISGARGPFRQQVHHFNPPVGLDYGLRDGILGDPPRDDPAPPEPLMPQDKPLPPVRDGFTRSPVPDNTIICPECDTELGDSEDETSRAIWVGKCGHCYCGDCAYKIRNPASTTVPGCKRKRAGRPVCSVDGCKQSFSGKRNFFQLYM